MRQPHPVDIAMAIIAAEQDQFFARRQVTSTAATTPSSPGDSARNAGKRGLTTYSATPESRSRLEGSSE